MKREKIVPKIEWIRNKIAAESENTCTVCAQCAVDVQRFYSLRSETDVRYFMFMLAVVLHRRHEIKSYEAHKQCLLVSCAMQNLYKQFVHQIYNWIVVMIQTKLWRLCSEKFCLSLLFLIRALFLVPLRKRNNWFHQILDCNRILTVSCFLFRERTHRRRFRRNNFFCVRTETVELKMLNTIIFFFMIVISFTDRITKVGVFIASDFASIENAHAHAECTSLFMNFSSFHFEIYLSISALCQHFKWRAQNVI